MRKTNGWNDYKQLILYRLDDQGKKIDRVVTTLEKVGEDVTGLKVKAAIAGGIAGLVGTGILSAVAQLLK